MKTSDLIVKALENEGVRYIFGIPGEENLDMLDSLRNSSIKWKQKVQGLEEQGLDFKNPDFVRYAESYGAFGHRVSSSYNLYEILVHTLNCQGVHLIDCPVNYKENRRVLIEELRAMTCKF